jgi:uncharacterized protein (TIGR02271 family)
MSAFRRRPWSELALLLGVGAALLIAAAVSGALDSPLAWTLLTALAAGYALSRGFARSRSPAWPTERAASRTAFARQPEAVADGAEVLVSEEQLQVDKVRRARERVVLRKEVVTERVTITVPVRREVVRLDRVPVADGELVGELAEISPARSQEMLLLEEVPLVDKRVVPRERVWLEKGVATRQEQITQTVRREEVAVDRLETSELEGEHR